MDGGRVFLVCERSLTKHGRRKIDYPDRERTEEAGGKTRLQNYLDSKMYTAETR